MTRICGILAMAVGLALAGCASDNMARQDSKTMDSSRMPTGVASGDTRYQSTQRDNGMASNTGTNTSTNDNMGANTSNGSGTQLGGGNDKNTAAASVSAHDNRFINDAIAGGMFEVSAGERALMKSSDTSVKNLAQHMVDDHTKVNTQINALATRKGVRVVGGMTTDQDKMLAQLDKLSGSDFDKEYLRQQQSAHEDAIRAFQDAANNSNDKDLRDWAATTLPTLREHLQMVQNQSNGTNGTNTNTGIGSEK